MGFGPRSSPATLPKRMSFGLLGATGGTALDFAAALRACTRSLNNEVAAAAPNARRLAIIAIFKLYGWESLGRAGYVFAGIARARCNTTTLLRAKRAWQQLEAAIIARQRRGRECTRLGPRRRLASGR